MAIIDKVHLKKLGIPKKAYIGGYTHIRIEVKWMNIWIIVEIVLNTLAFVYFLDVQTDGKVDLPHMKSDASMEGWKRLYRFTRKLLWRLRK